MAKQKRNQFATRDHEDFTILDSDKKVVGHIRIKPNRVMWSAKGGHAWSGVSLADFAAFMETHGKHQKQ